MDADFLPSAPQRADAVFCREPSVASRKWLLREESIGSAPVPGRSFNTVTSRS